MSGSAAAIAVLGLLEALAIAESIANQNSQKLDYNRQCLAEGLANLGGGFFQCLPGSGSLTRSAINFQSGAGSRLSGVIAAGTVALVLVLLAPLARYVPKAALAGLLVVTAVRLVEWRRLRQALRAELDRLLEDFESAGSTQRPSSSITWSRGTRARSVLKARERLVRVLQVLPEAPHLDEVEADAKLDVEADARRPSGEGLEAELGAARTGRSSTPSARTRSYRAAARGRPARRARDPAKRGLEPHELHVLAESDVGFAEARATRRQPRTKPPRSTATPGSARDQLVRRRWPFARQARPRAAADEETAARDRAASPPPCSRRAPCRTRRRRRAMRAVRSRRPGPRADVPSRRRAPRPRAHPRWRLPLLSHPAAPAAPAAPKPALGTRGAGGNAVAPASTSEHCADAAVDVAAARSSCVREVRVIVAPRAGCGQASSHGFIVAMSCVANAERFASSAFHPSRSKRPGVAGCASRVSRIRAGARPGESPEPEAAACTYRSSEYSPPAMIWSGAVARHVDRADARGVLVDGAAGARPWRRARTWRRSSARRAEVFAHERHLGWASSIPRRPGSSSTSRLIAYEFATSTIVGGRGDWLALEAPGADREHAWR